MDTTMRLGCPLDSCGWDPDAPATAEHLDAHSTVEWAAEVRRLRGELADVRRELAVAQQEGWRP